MGRATLLPRSADNRGSWLSYELGVPPPVPSTVAVTWNVLAGLP